jgi:hypothetical protein
MCVMPAALLAEQVRGRNLAVLEHELAHRGGAHSHLLDRLAGGVAGRATLDEKRRDAVADLRVSQHALRLVAVRDEHLAAVEHVHVAAPLGGRLHAEHVGTGARLGHRHRADPLARERPRQDPRALGGIGRVVEVVHEQHEVREVS